MRERRERFKLKEIKDNKPTNFVDLLEDGGSFTV